MAVVNELVTALGFKLEPDAEKNLKKIDDGIAAITKASAAMSKIFIGAKGALDYFTTSVMKDSQDMVNLSKTTGYSIEALQKWKYAAEASGVSADSVISDLENLRKQYLMNGDAVLQEADRLASMDRTTALQWAARWGMSDDTFNLLRQGSAKVREIMKDAYIIPSGKFQETAEANKRFQAIKANIRSIKDEIFMSLSPAVVDLTTKFGKWFEQNKQIISMKLQNVMEGTAKGFSKFGEIATSVLEKLKGIGEALGIIDENTPAAETVANIVTGTLLVMAGTKVLSGLAKTIVFIKNIIGGIKSVVIALNDVCKMALVVERYLRIAFHTGKIKGFIAALSRLLKLSKLAGAGAVAAGANMVVQGFKNLASGKYKNNWLEDLVKEPTEWVLRSLGVKEGSHRDWFYDKVYPRNVSEQQSITNNNQRVNMYFSQPITANQAMNQMGFSPSMLRAGAFGGTNQ